MRNVLLTLVALFMASTALADSFLYVEDFSVLNTQRTVTVPVKASFNGRVSGFQVDVTYPEGLTPVSIQKGSDLTVNYLNIDGEEVGQEATMFQNNEAMTRIIGAFTIPGYWDPDGDGDYQSYGVVKWEAGDYDEMFYLTMSIGDSFEGGVIELNTEVGSGKDTRGGTVVDLGENQHVFTQICNVTVEENLRDLMGEVVFGDLDTGVGRLSITYTGDEIVTLTVTLNGEVVELDSRGYLQLPSHGAWHIDVLVEAAGCRPLMASHDVEFKYETPAPVITSTLTDTEVLVAIEWPQSDGEQIYNGQYAYERTDVDQTYEVEAYTTDGDMHYESVHAHASIDVPARTVTPPTPPTDEYALTIADAEILHGKTVVIPVSMTNAGPVTAFQTDLYLPEGFELQNVELTDRKGDHVLINNVMGDGSVRLLCYSPSLLPFNDNEGVLFNLTVKVPESAAGDYPLYLKKNYLTTPAMVDGAMTYVEVRCGDATSNLNVWSYLPGDANGDGVVDVTDVVVTAQYILGLNPNPFVFEAADMSGDEEITVTDAVRITNLILNPSLIDLMRAPKPVRDNHDMMSGEDLQLSTGETRTVAIALDNDLDYTAFQLDIDLPDGLSADNFRLTDRAGSHALDANMLDNGKLRVMCYSPMLAIIDGNEGALLTFDVTATGGASGEIMVDGIEMVTGACQTVYLNGFAMMVNNGLTVAKEIAGDLRIYAEGQNIIVESPIAQRVMITDITGRAYSVDVAEGRTEIPARSSGVVIVKAGDKVAKLMIK